MSATNQAGKKIQVVAVGQTPPPFHGQGIMMQRLIEGQFEQVQLIHVRMAFSSEIDQVGRFQVGKLIHLLSVFLRIVLARIRSGGTILYYPPAGPNYVPMFRDWVLLIGTRWMFRHTVFHMHAGGVSTLYERLSPVAKFFFRWAYFQADAVILLSKFTVDDATGLHAKRVFIVPNCADDIQARFSTEDRKPTDRIKVSYLGTVCRTKGILVALEAIAKVKSQGGSVQFVVIGPFQPAEFEAEVKAEIERLGLQQDVELCGLLTGDEKWQKLSGSDLFCFPTFYESESFPCVILEAMSFGLPVVATRWRGIPSIVVEGETGFLVTPEQVEPLAERLLELSQDPSLRASMSVAARKRFERDFTTKQHLAAMENLFVDVSRS